MSFLLGALQFVGILILVVMVFNVLIIVHEWGHFLAARWRGLQVDKFQIWFGKTLWSKESKGVKYGLGSIPAGGFVALPQMAPMEAIEGGREEGAEPLPPIKPLDKIIVAVAGPLFSFLLAVFFAVIVWQVGYPVSDSVMTKTVGWVQKGGPAWEAGMRPGDEIQSVDGKPVDRFRGMIDSVTWFIVASENDQIEFDVLRDGKAKQFSVTPIIREPERKNWLAWVAAVFERPNLREVGISGKETPMVAKVSPNSPADRGGIEKNDLVVGINGRPLLSRADISEFVKENPGKPMELELLRGEERVKLEVSSAKPTVDAEAYMIGVVWDSYGKRVPSHPTPYVQVKNSLRTMASTLAAVFSPKSDISASHLSGPVGIMRLYYNLFKHPDGWKLVLWFSVILNINLAVLNMLPFPVLDGGHIMMALFEVARRKPINFRVLEVLQTGCALLLIGFMIFVTLKDAGDTFNGGKKAEAPTWPEVPVKDDASPPAPAPAGNPAPAPTG